MLATEAFNAFIEVALLSTNSANSSNEFVVANGAIFASIFESILVEFSSRVTTLFSVVASRVFKPLIFASTDVSDKRASKALSKSDPTPIFPDNAVSTSLLV